MAQGSGRLTTWQSLRVVAASWRLGSVALLSFASGLPLGVVWLAVPAWMKEAGVDIRVVGLFTLAQAPWSFKVFWAPLMDRFPMPFLGRKRGWVLVSQAVLLGLGVWMATITDPAASVARVAVICLCIAVASATQDIAYDAYTVEVLHREEHGMAVGARVAFYRVAMWLTGRVAITAAALATWSGVNFAFALVYLPLMLVTVLAPEPEALPQPPRTLREAVWEPFLGLLAQHRALEILAFVVLFKLSDNLTQSLISPFLIETGFSSWDVGVGAGTVGALAIVGGTFVGGVMTENRGLGPALWISGVLQLVSNLGYAVVAQVGPHRPALYLATLAEYVTSGMGNGAFGVLLLRLTQKRFSATQFALLTSLFSIPRILAGPPVGLLADALGWRNFFILTLAFGLPGLAMLQRFAPWGVRDPELRAASPPTGAPVAKRSVLGWSALVAASTWSAGVVALATLAGIKDLRGGGAFAMVSHLEPLLRPHSAGEWLSFAGVLVTAAAAGLMTAAVGASQGREAPTE
jgi:MFS transporter, PAT family, beta-lactamase induction signal transducer AmpG